MIKDRYTFNSLASFNLLHKISGPFALVAVARALHRLLQVFAPSSSHFTTKPGVWDRSGAASTSGVGVGNPPQEQFPFGPSSTVTVALKELHISNFLIKTNYWNIKMKFAHIV